VQLHIVHEDAPEATCRCFITEPMAIGRTTVSGRTYAALWLNFEDTGLVRYRDHSYAAHTVTYYVHGDDELEFRIPADNTENGVCTIGVVGRYVGLAP